MVSVSISIIKECIPVHLRAQLYLNVQILVTCHTKKSDRKEWFEIVIPI